MKKQTILLACSALFLAACGGNNNNGSQPADTSSAAGEATISTQFIGHYGEMANFGFDYYAILNLYSDGTLQLSGYQALSRDVSDWQTNTGFSYDWGHGNWKVGKDEEGDDATIMSITYGKDQTNVMTGEPNVGTFKYTIYPKADGSASFTCNLPIVSGREATMESNGQVQFADYNAFIQAKKYVFTEPTNAVAKLDDTTNGCRIYVLNDKTALWVSGGTPENPSTYAEFTTGSWSNVDGAFTLTFGSETKAATVTGTTATVTLTYDPYSGYRDPIQATFTGDISAVPVESAGDTPAAATVKATLEGKKSDDETATASITLMSDGTGTFLCSMGGHDLTDAITWTWASYTLTIKAGEDTKVTAVPDGTTYNLSFTYHKVVVAGTYEFDYNFVVGPSVYMGL